MYFPEIELLKTVIQQSEMSTLQRIFEIFSCTLSNPYFIETLDQSVFSESGKVVISINKTNFPSQSKLFSRTHFNTYL